MKHVVFPGRILMIGFGSIGQGVLPLLLRHFRMDRERIEIVTADPRGIEIAREHGIKFTEIPLTPENYEEVVGSRLAAGDFLLNLSVDVSSLALIQLARRIGAFYLDTCIEPWAGGYTDTSLSASQRSNYALREQALALSKDLGEGPTALVAHGANPGLVSHFVKEALLHLADDLGVGGSMPTSRSGWATLAEKLGVKVIHIAERDTQVAAGKPKQKDEFVNTWSIDGFVGEGCQPAELGWGSHEPVLPPDGCRHDFGCDSAIYLMRPGAATQVRTWTPLEGPFHGFLITHNESISIADYFTRKEAGEVVYRPTVHYAYHPCDDAVLSLHELAGKGWQMQSKQRLLVKDVTSGIDELGVLLMGHERGAFWYGSRLSVGEARKLAPHNNATSLQVTATIIGGMAWVLENPRAGMVEADAVDHRRVMEHALPYLGEMVGVYSDWTPLQGRGVLFPEELDRAEPWSFANFRVS